MAEPLKILSLDGGGYLGLATGAFIEATELHWGRKFSDEFELFCGTSTGSIIAICLALGGTGAEIVSLYESLGCEIFARPRFAKGYVSAKYSNEPLRRVLTNHFGNRTIGDIYNSGKKLLIPAFSITEGRPRIFKTDHHVDLNLDNKLKLVDVAMASSAAPTYFPTYSFETKDGISELFCDGGVAANHPALLGYAEALKYLGRQPKDIRALSISTPRMDLSKRATTTDLDWGKVRWGLEGIASILTDSNSYLADSILGCLASGPADQSPVYVRISLENKEKYGMDDVSRESTRVLKLMGTEAANRGDVRKQIAVFKEDR